MSFPIPREFWSSFKVHTVAIANGRPRTNTAVVYEVGLADEPEKDIIDVGSGHLTPDSDGSGRIGNILSALLGFNTYHSAGLTLRGTYSPQHIANFWMMWAHIDGCPILAERELIAYHRGPNGNSPNLINAGVADTKYCRNVCRPQNLGWKVIP
jgi:hypothetical protein